MSLQVFEPGKARGAGVALEVLLQQVDRADVPLVALLPGKLHSAILALELFLGRVHRAHVDGETVVAAVHLAADGASHLVVDSLDLLVNVPHVLLQVAHQSEGRVALVTLERPELEVGAVDMPAKVAVVPELFWALVAGVHATLLVRFRLLLRTSPFRNPGLGCSGRSRSPPPTFPSPGVGFGRLDFV